MDVGPDPNGFQLRASGSEVEELWAEHGWGLTWWQVAAIFGVIALVSAASAILGT